MDEEVDILQPPLFTPTGTVKTRRQAYQDGDWIGTFNLWIVTRNPEPAILYQQRSPQAKWAPHKLDVTGGGHLQAGERLTDGLREVEEELGKRYSPHDLIHLGRKLYVGFNPDSTSHNNIIDLYMIEDDAPLHSYHLEPSEVFALCVCPVKELLRVHQEDSYSFTTTAMTADGHEATITVTKDSFPENWDEYHYKIALLAERYFNGEEALVY